MTTKTSILNIVFDRRKKSKDNSHSASNRKNINVSFNVKLSCFDI